MNNKNDKKSPPKSTGQKFKKIRTDIPFSTRLINNFIKLKKNQVHKSYRFWITNVVFLCFFAKTIQLMLYVKEFVVSVPREDAINNLMINDFKNLNVDKIDNTILHNYLDKLEKMKKERSELNKKELNNN